MSIKSILSYIIFLGVFISGAIGFAQSKIITGNITDETGLPLPGVSVIIKNTTTGTTTDFNGDYNISANAGDILVFSYIGYTTVEQTVGDADTLDIQMTPGASELDEVIIVGYGTSTKQTFVGTAAKVEAEDIESKNTTNVSQALAGEAAGVTVINTSGQPGSASTIRIRGFGSIIGNRDPLYVVDGIPFNGNINSINKADIESMTVLKDAAATAIYGSRGANGVVLITTKKGKSGKSEIEIWFNRGENSRILPEYDMVENQEQYVELGWEALKNFAIAKNKDNPTQYANTNIFSSKGINPHYNMWNADGPDLIDPATGKFKSGVARKYTPENWSDLLFRNGSRSEGHLRLSGGVDKTTYSTSFGALEDNGYLINSNFKRYNTRVDVGHEIRSWLKGSFNLGYTYIESSQVGQDADATSAFWFATGIPSIYPVYLRDGNGKLVPDTIFGGNQYDFGDNGRGFGLGSNPVATTILDIDQTTGHEINGNTMLEAKFLENFTFTAKYGLQNRHYAIDERGNVFYGFSAATGGNIFKRRITEFTNVLLQSLSYKNTFGLHTVEARAFHETQQWDYYYLSTFKQQLADPDSIENNNAVVNRPSTSFKWDFRIESFFGSLDYNFDEKYYIALVARRDGSSRFLNNKWGTFYSAGFSWIASKEDFLSDLSWIDLLKWKISYGTNGDQDGAGLYSGYDLFNVNNLNDKPSFAFNIKGNPDLTWESSEQFQLGTEFDLLDRISAEVDYYVKTTDNLLVNRKVGPSVGYRNIAFNDGALRNSGLEFNLTGHLIKTNDAKLELNVNGALAQNTITAMPIDPATNEQKVLDQVGIYGRAVGQSIFDHYMREFAGVDPETGVSQWYVNYVDQNNDGAYTKGEEISSLTLYQKENPGANIREGTTKVYSDATQRFTGTSAIPDIAGAFRLKGDFKGLELVAQFLYQFGGTGYDFMYAGFMNNQNPGNANYHKDILNRWQKPGDNTGVPRLSAEADLNVNSPSSRFLTSSDYLALNNLRIGYNFSERLSEKLYVDKISLWASGDNLWLKSKRSGFNPTTSETADSSVYNYAPLSTVVLGIKVQF